MTASVDNEQDEWIVVRGTFARILTFHKIVNRPTFGVTNFRPARCERLLTAVRSAGYDFKTVQDVADNSSPDSVGVTFDDGYEHLRDVLPRLMQKHKFVPLVLVPTAWLGKPNRWDYSHFLCNVPHLDKPGIRDLAGQGVQFGTHGHNHIDLTRCSPDVAREELRRSRQILEDILGHAVTAISYPFGRVNASVKDLAREEGYTLGLTMRFPSNSDSHLSAGRIPVYSFDSRLAVLRRLKGGKGAVIERLKAGFTNCLSGGTVTLNRFRKIS
ncbi:MAG: polysaccharide deacetylase family protein [Candidatus Zixiibacteriota bacterium]|nr:MAG: polysaccharide deacetylase family protein [candidate division Zixibacteria bacterium]